ncbi:hypothetical protein [Allomesorhizobium camelthorni]|uniref:Uncharacterized protein n=1 Tax=Allomesorhizobium camelthorni TaxID=475069 RepID=A0A6G4W9V3_9HYPH|nr:hypothetical protein [Mesorhizobium camelthorni]NGO51354.1 hypothetical protein [Mesorhizobium camelthorni]
MGERTVMQEALFNVMVLDKTGGYAVVCLSPDRDAVVRKIPLTTNHQLALEWPEGDRRSETAERAKCLAELRSGSPDLAVFIDAAHQTPLYRTDYNEGLGTLHECHPALRRGGRISMA